MICGFGTTGSPDDDDDVDAETGGVEEDDTERSWAKACEGRERVEAFAVVVLVGLTRESSDTVAARTRCPQGIGLPGENGDASRSRGGSRASSSSTLLIVCDVVDPNDSLCSGSAAVSFGSSLQHVRTRSSPLDSLRS